MPKRIYRLSVQSIIGATHTRRSSTARADGKVASDTDIGRVAGLGERADAQSAAAVSARSQSTTARSASRSDAPRPRAAS
jgi:hypothetical protein